MLQNPKFDTLAGSPELANSLDGLRKKDGMHRLLQESFDCDRKRPTEHLKEVIATGKSGSDAMKTADGRFRLKSLLPDEYTFWGKRHKDKDNKATGEIFAQHWRDNPLTAMVKYYALVSDGIDLKSQMWVVMREAFSGMKDSGKARIYDLKGSDRKDTAGSEGKEQDFNSDFGAISLYAEGIEQSVDSSYQLFAKTVTEDVKLLKSLKVHDYSLVVRTSPGVLKPPFPWKQRGVSAVQTWRGLPKWAGAGSVIAAMHWPSHGNLDVKSGKDCVFSVVLLDYLQDSTTWHNMGAASAAAIAKQFKGQSKSKIFPNAYAERFQQYILDKFRPFTVVKANPHPYMFCISNPDVSFSSAKDFMESAKTRGPGAKTSICKPLP